MHSDHETQAAPATDSMAAAIERMRAIATALPKRQRAEPSDAEVEAAMLDMAGCGYLCSAPAVPIVRAFLGGEGAIISGTQGAGKTHLLRALGVPIAHCNDCIAAQYGLDGIGDWFAFWDGKPVCLDDLGVEPTATHYGARDELLTQVIGHRAERQSARTFATTNLSAEKIAERYGDRTLSRLLGMCRPFRFDGHDWRLKRPTRSIADYAALHAVAKLSALVEWQASSMRPSSACMRQVAATLRGVYGIIRRPDGTDPRGDAVSRGIETAWAQIDGADGPNAPAYRAAVADTVKPVVRHSGGDE